MVPPILVLGKWTVRAVRIGEWRGTHEPKLSVVHIAETARRRVLSQEGWEEDRGRMLVILLSDKS